MTSHTSNSQGQVSEASGESGASQSNFAASLRGFGPAGIFAILLILLTGNVIFPNMILLPVGAILAWVWVRMSHTPWREIGYIKPRSWMGEIMSGFVIGIVFKLVMKVIVMPLLGAEPVNGSYHFLAGNKTLLPVAIISMFIAGIAEETVFRGFMFERLGKLLGSGVRAKILIVAMTSIGFALGHYFNLGITGVEQAIVTGLVFGTTVAITGRLYLVMCMHAAFDVTSVLIIYWDIEREFAHFIFR